MVLKLKTVPTTSARGEWTIVEDSRVSRVPDAPAGEQTGVGRDGPLPSPFGEAFRGSVLVDMVPTSFEPNPLEVGHLKADSRRRLGLSAVVRHMASSLLVKARIIRVSLNPAVHDCPCASICAHYHTGKRFLALPFFKKGIAVIGKHEENQRVRVRIRNLK